MKPAKISDDLIASKISALQTVARRIAKIRGMDDSEDGDGCEKTNADPEETSQAGVCVIPIRGILARDCKGWFPWATDTEEIEELLDEAENDANVKAIVLDIDSPGGCVNGSIELADFVAGIQKPIVAFTAGDCCSAAYWIASGCDQFVIRRSATVASVGVYSAVLDVTGAYEQLGIKVELFKSGENKAAGFPGTTLTDEQRAVIQEEMLRLSGLFQSHVLTYRPEIDIEMLDGRCVRGEAAVASGFADEIVGGLNNAVSAAKTLGGMDS